MTNAIKLNLVTNYVKALALNVLIRYRSNENPTMQGFKYDPRNNGFLL